MIVEKDTDIEQFGALKGETIQMGFAAEAIGQLMDNMAKTLYSRPKEAVMREYVTNAYDAQLEVGETRPVEVTLPTPLNPLLRIRDFGVGLDLDSLKRVYSQYGASTKRDSNDFNGTLGLGCKSAFAYTNRFVVVSVKDGIRYEIVVTRNEDGTASMVVMDPRPVSDADGPNGVEIQVAAKRGDTFEAEARKLYCWFPQGAIMVNGQVVPSWSETEEGSEALEVAPGMYVVNHGKGRRWAEEQDDLIVMGNVAYPFRLDTDLDRNKHHLVCFVPNGSVQFMSSRESLLLNSVTRRKTDELAAAFQKALISTLQKNIDAAPSKAAAAAVVANWNDIVPAKIVPQGGYEYKGEAIPNEAELASHETHMRLLPTEKSGHHNAHKKVRSVGVERFAGTLWVEGFALENVTASHAQKARQYIAEQELSIPGGIILTPRVPTEVRPWIEKIVSYDDVKAVKLPRSSNYVPGSSGRIPGSYDLYTSDPVRLKAFIAASYSSSVNPPAYCSLVGVAAEEFRHWKAPLYYAVGRQHENSKLRAALHLVSGGKPYTLVSMHAARKAKFLRNFPAAQSALTVVAAGYAAWETTTGKDAALALAVQADWQLRRFERLRSVKGQIADPELIKYVDLACRDLTNVENAANIFRSVLGRRLTNSVKLPNFDASYPLLDTTQPKHTIFYVNAVYTARQAGQKL